MKRRYAIGAEYLPESGVHFRVWAPASADVSVELYPEPGKSPDISPLQREPGGYHSGLVPAARLGMRYKFKLQRGSFPDPASRFQPEGPHGPSEIVDTAYAWTDAGWRGRPTSELVIYELHVGTFTREGTWRAAAAELPELARLGITMIEVMPIAEFPGDFGWGYDGVDFFAPTRLYGTPREVRAFIDRAHELGLMVILDVVYNHFGPDGNYLREFAPDYFSTKYKNEWGDPLNFDGKSSGPVREFFVTNARYWIEEYHFDGLRLDATQQIYDASPTHIISEINDAVRQAAGERRSFVVAECETQKALLVRSRAAGGSGLDAIWNDDFHHSARVAATGRAEAYYSGFRGRAQEFVSAAKHGFLYQGQWYMWQQKRRGTPAFGLRPQNFVHFLDNHDQVANALHGWRLHELTSPARYRALTALLLLSPQIPMLFQGQEFAASAPFVYFAHHQQELAAKVAEGRGTFLRQFPSVDGADCRRLIADPGAVDTFRRCKLDLSERVKHARVYRLHEDLLRLRREDATLAQPQAIDGAVLADQAFVLRYFSAAGLDRLLLVNLGGEVRYDPAPEPLLAPVEGQAWRGIWDSEAPAYGGSGLGPVETKANWIIPGEAVVLFAPDENRELADARLYETH